MTSADCSVQRESRRRGQKLRLLMGVKAAEFQKSMGAKLYSVILSSDIHVPNEAPRTLPDHLPPCANVAPRIQLLSIPSQKIVHENSQKSWCAGSLVEMWQ